MQKMQNALKAYKKRQRPFHKVKPTGRPIGSGLIFKPEDWYDKVCDWISTGKTLKKFCAIDGNPCSQLIYQWRDKDEVFRDQLARARGYGHEAILDECIDIADDETEPDPNRTKVRVWTRMELLKMWDPARWAEQKRLALSGTIGLEALVAGAAKMAEEKPAEPLMLPAKTKKKGGYKAQGIELGRMLEARSSDKDK